MMGAVSMDEQLSRIDAACVAFFQTHSQEAHALLLSIGLDIRLFSHLLTRLQSPYTVIFAASRLKQLLTPEAARCISGQDAVQLNDLLFQLLNEAVSRNQVGMVPALMIALSRTVSLFWLEHDGIRQFLKHATALFERSPAHAKVALELCSSLVQDMQPPAGNFDRAWRKRCLALRDSSLSGILQLALHAGDGSLIPEHLPFAAQLQGSGVNDPTRKQLREASAHLILSVLSYDFNAHAIDAPEENRSISVHVPLTWHVVRDPQTIDLLFRLFDAGPAATVATDILRALSQLLALKNTFFPDTTQRMAYADRILSSVCTVLDADWQRHAGAVQLPPAREHAHLREESVVHALGQLLATLLSHYRLIELIDFVPSFTSALIPRVAALTTRVLFAFDSEMFENSSHFLVLFWSDVCRQLSQLPLVVFSGTAYASITKTSQMVSESDTPSKSGMFASPMTSATRLGLAVTSSMYPSTSSLISDMDMTGSLPRSSSTSKSAETIAMEERCGRAIIETLFEFARMYIESKLALSSLLSTDDQAKLLEDPLSDNTPSSQLSSMSSIFRLHADRLSPIIMGHWNEAARALHGLRGQSLTSEFVEQWRSAEGRLAWLTYMATCLLEGLNSPGSARPIVPSAVLERQAELYAQLVYLVFECMHWLRDARKSSMDCGAPAVWQELERDQGLGERFQVASLHLCVELHQVATCDSADQPPSIAFLHTLTTSMRVDPGGTGLLEGLVIKAFTDLSEWSQSSLIIDRVVSLLETLSTGLKIVYLPTSLPRVYSNGKLLLESAFVQSLLHTNSPDKFSFLRAPVFVRHGHARRRFWLILSRLYFMQPEATVAANFDAYVSPIFALRNRFQQLAAAMPPVGSETYSAHSNEMISCVDCILRDARGLLQACRKSHSYRLAFRFVISPAGLGPILSLGQDMASASQLPVRTRNLMLRLCAELLDNTCRRIEFSIRSVAPYELVRAVSRIVRTNCMLLRQINVNSGQLLPNSGSEASADAYLNKYSGVRSCAEACTAMLLGDYVNLELLALYGDDSYRMCDDVLELVLSVPSAELVAHPKLHTSVLPLLQCICDCAPWRILRAPSEAWPAFFELLRDALCMTTSGAQTAGPKASQRAVAGFVQALSAANRLLACVVCVLFGSSALMIQSASGAGSTASIGTGDLEQVLENFEMNELRARAQQLVEFAVVRVFPALLRPVVIRAASLPYADKSATAHFVFCVCLLLHRTAPTDFARQYFGDAVGNELQCGGGLGLLCEALDEQVSLTIAAAANASDPEGDRHTLRLAIESAVIPLHVLIDAALGRPVTSLQAQALLASIKPDAESDQHTALRELFEQRISELFVRFVE